MQPSLKITGANEVLKAIQDLPAELMRKAERFVLRDGAKPILQSMKGHAQSSKSTGLLLKSLGISVRKVKATGGTAQMTAHIGARSGFKGKSLGFKLSKRGKTKGTMIERFADPSKYVHLVELGTSRSAAKPFIRPAIESAKNQCLANMAEGIDKFLTHTVAKLKAKG